MIVEYDCEWCGTHVRKKRSPSTMRGNSGRFCSQKCNGAAKRGTGSGHHINHVRDDNRPENLQLFASHSDHMKHHAMENANV